MRGLCTLLAVLAAVEAEDVVVDPDAQQSSQHSQAKVRAEDGVQVDKVAAKSPKQLTEEEEAEFDPTGEWKNLERGDDGEAFVLLPKGDNVGVKNEHPDSYYYEYESEEKVDCDKFKNFSKEVRQAMRSDHTVKAKVQDDPNCDDIDEAVKRIRRSLSSDRTEHQVQYFDKSGITVKNEGEVAEKLWRQERGASAELSTTKWVYRARRNTFQLKALLTNEENVVGFGCAYEKSSALCVFNLRTHASELEKNLATSEELPAPPS
ncbi:unnamed protein product [Cylicocyclus nassatus]|uniref:Uncharacterized protein n=1 Tax=Cylicocyclus nassatus TaxID=53992 RepID=A0AA36DQ33_CYLNA|nr:unnamed protein product [Cylicocyclus nassatus]